MQKKEVSLQELMSAKRSIKMRKARMREITGRYRSQDRNPEVVKSPIEAIGVFNTEITEMENVLEKMQNRIDNVKIEMHY